MIKRELHWYLSSALVNSDFDQNVNPGAVFEPLDPSVPGLRCHQIGSDCNEVLRKRLSVDINFSRLTQCTFSQLVKVYNKQY